MNQLPIFLNVRGQRALVVGGGGVAARKVTLFLRAGAKVEVVAPKLCAALKQLLAEGGISHLSTPFDLFHLDSASVMFTSTSDTRVNFSVSKAARERGFPVNVADNPSLCSFIVPSIVDRSAVVIVVATGGAAPVLARSIRARLETLIPASIGRLASLAGEFRDKVKARFKDIRERRIFRERALSAPIAELVHAAKDAEARAMLNQALETSSPEADKTGEVYLVGAGPGDRDLLTFRALRLMQRADVVISHGLSPEMPAALVEQGTTEGQRVLTGTLSTLPGKAALGTRGPALIIIGDVVRLRNKLGWFAPQRDDYVPLAVASG